MIAAILIRGKIDARQDVKDTLTMLNLDRKHACVVLEDTPVVKGMLNKCKDFITFGDISEKTQQSLEKIKQGKVARLHPPRGGLKSIKRSTTNGGDLGPRQDMDTLIERMLP